MRQLFCWTHISIIFMSVFHLCFSCFLMSFPQFICLCAVCLNILSNYYGTGHRQGTVRNPTHTHIIHGYLVGEVGRRQTAKNNSSFRGIIFYYIFNWIAVGFEFIAIFIGIVFKYIGIPIQLEISGEKSDVYNRYIMQI